MDERKKNKRNPVVGKIRRRKSSQLKVIWEYDKDVPEEERERRIEQIFSM